MRGLHTYLEAANNNWSCRSHLCNSLHCFQSNSGVFQAWLTPSILLVFRYTPATSIQVATYDHIGVDCGSCVGQVVARCPLLHCLGIQRTSLENHGYRL